MNDCLNKKDRYLLRYTVMFLCVALPLIVLLAVSGKSWIMGYDGQYQHYPALMYLGNYIRDGISGAGWKMVDLSLGQGLDVLATLGYYCFTEPLAILTAWVPAAYTEIAYCGLVLLRMYLAGLFTCLLAREYRAEKWAAAIAGLMYAFGAFAVVGAMKHLNFGIGLLFLPLLLLTVERYFKRGEWGPYVVVVALMLISNYYFAYMNTVLAIIYIIVTLIGELKEKPVKACAKKGFGLLGGYLLGAAMSAVIFLPSAYAYLSNGRIGDAAGYSGSLWHYSLFYYAEWVACFFHTTRAVVYWGMASFIPVAAFTLCALFINRRKGAGRIRVMLVIFVVMLCLPIVGKVMNGMGYVSNRWSYALGLFVALATAVELPGLQDDGRRWKKWVAILGMALVVVSIAAFRDIPSLFVVLAFAAVIVVLCPQWVRLPKMRVRPERRARALSVMATVLVGMYAFLHIAPVGDNEITSFRADGNYDRVVRDEMAYFDTLEDDAFYRVAKSMDKGSMQYQDGHAHEAGYNGVSFYWSLIPSEISDHYIDLYSNTLEKTFKLLGPGGAADMNLLSSVKYFIRSDTAQDVMPYGYEEMDTHAFRDKNYIIYENKYALPLGYVYDEAMGWEEYQALNTVAKRDALLEKAVIGGEAGVMPASGYAGLSRQAEMSLENFEQGDRAAFGIGSGIRCEVPERSEVYVVFEDLQRRSGDSGRSYENFFIQGDQGANYVSVAVPDSNFAYPQKGANVYMGVFEPGQYAFEITGDETVTYSCADVRVYYRPVEAYAQAAEKLGECVMENIEVGTNRISGTVAMDGPGYLQIAVPWHEGWRATVDGVEQEILLCGGMYMGLALEAGDHVIELSYVTPYIKEGLAISMAALAVFLTLVVVKKGKKGAFKG